jgi:hypothetical protein
MVYADAYIMLDTERKYTEYVPWSACVAYGQYYGFTRDQTDWLIEIVRLVDKVIVPKRVKQSGNAKGSS